MLSGVIIDDAGLQRLPKKMCDLGMPLLSVNHVNSR